MSIARYRPVSSRRQQGSILIPAALVIMLALLLLWGVQLGYAFYLKRELQKTADMAALSAAQVLERGHEDDCAAAESAARSAIMVNIGGLNSEDVSCKRWDGKDEGLAPRYIRDADISGGESYNAITIQLSIIAPSLFPFTEGTTLYAEAVAARPAEPIAAFSVGTTAVGPGDQDAILLGLLRGVGLNLDKAVLVGYDSGLANIKITPSGLLNALGIDVPADISVGQLNALLATQTRPLGGLLDAVVTVAGHNDLTKANVGLLHAIETRIQASDLQVRLGSEESGRSHSLFASISAPDAQAALNTEVNALDLISTAIGVGTYGHAIESETSIDIPDFLSVPSKSLVSIKPRFSVIEPPSITIGGVGSTAYTAQIRLFLPVKISTPAILSKLVDLNMNLPIVVDLVDGKATLQSLCDSRDGENRDLAHIAVESSLLKICIGGPPAGADLDTWPFSTNTSCDQGLEKVDLVSLGLKAPLNINLLKLHNKLSLDALAAYDEADFYAGQQRRMPETANPLLIGDTVKNATDALLAALLGSSLQPDQSLNSSQNSALRKQLATKFWDDTASDYPCEADGQTGSNGKCRGKRQKAALTAISASTDGLGGFLGGLATNTLGVVGNLVTLDIGGVVGNVGGLVNGLLGTVGNTLTQLTEALGLGPCSSALTGTQQGCINTLSDTMAMNASVPAAGNPPNALVALAGVLLGGLQQPLNSLGTDLVKPAMEDVVGLQIGQTDVNLMSLECNGKGVQLVY